MNLTFQVDVSNKVKTNQIIEKKQNIFDVPINLEMLMVNYVNFLCVNVILMEGQCMWELFQYQKTNHNFYSSF